MSSQKAAFRWLPAFGIMAVIFVLSSLPSADVPDFGLLDALVKNGGHFVGYALLALAYSFALPRRFSRLERGVAAVGLALLYALSDEFHQSFIAGRSASWSDILVDGLGASIAALLWARYSPNSNSNPINSSES